MNSNSSTKFEEFKTTFYKSGTIFVQKNVEFISYKIRLEYLLMGSGTHVHMRAFVLARSPFSFVCITV
jgi:hypothetical protein